MNKNKGKFNSKPFFRNKDKGFKPQNRQSFEQFVSVDKAVISDVTLDKKGKRLELSGIIDRIVQTGGPTVFYLSDGTGTLALKGFEAPGARAHAHILEGDAVITTITVEE